MYKPLWKPAGLQGFLAVVLLSCLALFWVSCSQNNQMATNPSTDLNSQMAIDALTDLALAKRGGSGEGAGDDLQFSEWSAPVNLGPVVNSPLTDIEVAISKDGRSLYLASNRPGGFGGFDIWVSQRASVDDAWGTPQNLGPIVNTSENEQSPFLAIDGHRMYFLSNRPGGLGGNDLYVSQRHHKRDDFGWQPPENLGGGVNTSSNENLPVRFEDILYFNSNRPGGVGATDIYASSLQPDGTFGPVVLVPELSSPLRDAGMAIRRDGLEMILASDRAGSIGGFDLWSSTRPSTSDPWSTPVHLGVVVNTASGESRLALSFDGTTLYIISDRPGGVGNLDLWVSTRSKLNHGDDKDDD